MIAFNDGDAFEGLVRRQELDGEFMAKEGKFVFADGSYYIGEWLKNLPHGRGKHRFADGSFY